MIPMNVSQGSNGYADMEDRLTDKGWREEGGGETA